MKKELRKEIEKELKKKLKPIIQEIIETENGLETECIKDCSSSKDKRENLR